MNQGFDCAFCRSQGGRLRDDFARRFAKLGPATIKFCMFHEPCRRCDDPEATKTVRLCDQCRHLRLHHVLSCFKQDVTDDRDLHRSWDEDLEQEHENSDETKDQDSDETEDTSSDKFEDADSAEADDKFDDFDDDVNQVQLSSPHRELFDVLLPLSSTEGCDLCDFFAACENPRFLDSDACEPPYLKVDPSNQCRLTPSYRTLRLNHSESRSLYVRPYIDWQWLQRWISRCRSKVKTVEQRQLILDQEPRNLRVIDVIHGCVVPLPPRATYIALSYVWGIHVRDTFRCELVNVSLLAQPGSLSAIALPQTIVDAMTACLELDERFLWVDRLCIIQDDPEISVQLDQMAIIYHHAKFTIVAAEGDGDQHGLSGVGYARPWKHPAVRYNDHFELFDEVPNFHEYLRSRHWNQRAWTYQENEASSNLLYFTDEGLFYISNIGEYGETFAEGPAPSAYTLKPREKYNVAQVIRDYTKRTLTFPNDKLRAISGIFHALHGDRCFWGMPWLEFELAMLWYQDGKASSQQRNVHNIFPTWSWLASTGAVRFRTIHTSSCLRWVIGADQPTKIMWRILCRSGYRFLDPGMKISIMTDI
ncbi:HET-domain-containing protein [Phaeosphaeriaceae sp. SRC1lsM3a]|nr:HET-domain-containing protein [Stagonospora sp. SRC1lsM3a]